MTQVRQHFFRPPARTSDSWFQVAVGVVLLLIVTLGTLLGGWDRGAATLVLLGTFFLVSGLAERLPQERTSLAGVLRIIALVLALVCVIRGIQWLLASTQQL